MLTSILDDIIDSNEPSESKRKNNLDNINIKNRDLSKNNDKKVNENKKILIPNKRLMNEDNNYFQKENDKYIQNNEKNSKEKTNIPNSINNLNNHEYIYKNNLDNDNNNFGNSNEINDSFYPKKNDANNFINQEKNSHYINDEQNSIYKSQNLENDNPMINNNVSPKVIDELEYNNLDNIQEEEYYIKYVTLNRQGYEYIHERNYFSGLSTFKNCYDLANNYLKDKIKEINSLINISICQYYNGNFTESYIEINKSKSIYDFIASNIPKKLKLTLSLKLFVNSSLANLSVNNYNESKNDITFLISTIRKVTNINKQFLYFRTIIFTLFKVESLINCDIKSGVQLKNTKNSYINSEIEPSKIINHLMKGFIHFLKEKKFSILLSIFKEAAQKYKKINDLNGYYFSLFYHYIILYNLKKDEYEENELEDIKKKISICNNNLIGNELIDKVKEKDINKLLNEFIDKINCVCEIFQLLENFEIELNTKLKEYIKEKNSLNISEDENNLSFSHLQDKSHIFTNDQINSLIIIKLLLRFSINFLEEKKIMEINKSNNKNNNYDILINEVKIMLQKISNNEINTENVKIHHLDKEVINSLKQLFDNLIYIYYKCKLFKYFKKFRKKAKKVKNYECINEILDFLIFNSEKLINGIKLVKINYKSDGYKKHFYNINEKKKSLCVWKSKNMNYPNKFYNLKKDIIKITYGNKTRNLRRKLLSKDMDKESIKFLRIPWRILSIITKKRSIDLYCDDNQINYMFYGLKYFFIDNKVAYKINSTNFFVINKIKLKIAIILKQKFKDEDIENIPNIIKLLIKEKSIQNISFTKLFLLYNKYK